MAFKRPAVSRDQSACDDTAATALHQIQKSFGNHEVLSSTDLSVPSGGVLSIVGLSGSGQVDLGQVDLVARDQHARTP